MERDSGSMGRTRSGKYTLVPRDSGLLVQRAAPLYIVRNVRDMHGEEIIFSVLAPGNAHRVVEVARVVAVDGDDKFVPEIPPPRERYGFARGARRFRKHLLREGGRQICAAMSASSSAESSPLRPSTSRISPSGFLPSG